MNRRVTKHVLEVAKTTMAATLEWGTPVELVFEPPLVENKIPDIPPEIVDDKESFDTPSEDSKDAPNDSKESFDLILDDSDEEPPVTVIAYTDGSCMPNPGPGAWAFHLIWPDDPSPDDERDYVGEVSCSTTNNREELKAITEVMKLFTSLAPEKSKLIVRTDNQNCIGWIMGTFKRNKNHDLFVPIDEMTALDYRFKFEHVKSHSGDVLNERVDRLAKNAVIKYKQNPTGKR